MDPLIVLVNGLPGSGKSTVSRHLAGRLPRAAWLEGDHLQHVMTVSGCVGPGEEPEAESRRQLDLRWRNLAALTSNFLGEDFTVIVDSLLIPSLLGRFRELVGDVPLAYIHLDPDRAVGLARDAARGHKRIGDRFDWVAAEFEAFRGSGAWIDSTDHTVEQTVAAAHAALLDGSACLDSVALSGDSTGSTGRG